MVAAYRSRRSPGAVGVGGGGQQRLPAARGGAGGFDPVVDVAAQPRRGQQAVEREGEARSRDVDGQHSAAQIGHRAYARRADQG
jgi:hypothetical protein